MTTTGEHLKFLDDPVLMADQWIAYAYEQNMPEHNAMALATASKQGVPSVRFVLFKGLKDGCFCFFTNYESRKARDLIENPIASFVFFWPLLKRQMRVEGTIEKATRAESEAYFASRERVSQIGAWASPQSRDLNGYDELMGFYDEVEARFKDKNVPCPDHWGGFKLKPTSIEFWLAGDGRLHERAVYRKLDAEHTWTRQWLAP